MKYKLKIIPKLLFIAFLILASCSKDEFEEQIRNSKNKNDISFSEFKKETGLTNFSTSISIPHNTSLAKTSDGKYELNDFNIQTDIIKRLELDTKVTYTFKITPLEIIDEKEIYNLIVYQKDGEWKKSIIEYTPTEENYQKLVNGITDRIQGNMKLLYQENDISVTCITITIITYHCPLAPGHCSGTNGDCDALEGTYCPICATYQHFTFCTVDEDGNNSGANDGSDNSGVPVDTGGPYGGGEGTDGTNHGSSPTTTNPDDNSIPTIPNLEHLNINNGDPNPCQELKTKSLQTEFKSKFNTLNNAQHYSLDHETAYAETKSGNTKSYQYYQSASGENNHIDFSNITNCVSFMHVHNDDYTLTDSYGEDVPRKTAKIPSIQDLHVFLSSTQIKAQQNGVNIGETYAMTLSSQAIFCFKIKTANLLELFNVVNSSGINWDNFKRECDNATMKILKNQTLNDNQKLEAMQKVLLSKIKDKGLDQFVGLYQGTVSGTGVATTINWKEEVLDANNALAEIPCP